ncbi:prepilin peptidase [Actinobacillus equuli subsp. haemolyticus]|nr:prepilin peptidase [Actinobacillus equuli subsp. haemolyticus]
METVEFNRFFATPVAFLFAFWCKRAIKLFANHINQQVYQEYSSLLSPIHSYDYFSQHSKLQPKQSYLANFFFWAFPLLIFHIPSTTLAFLLMILLFLSVLDYCYYLTDIRYVIAIFVLALVYEPMAAHIETLLGCILFFTCLHYGILWFWKKEAFGIGDSLVISSISPLFNIDDMLKLILLASVSGCIYYFGYQAIMKRTLVKLPFIPFISFSTFVLIIDKIYA